MARWITAYVSDDEYRNVCELAKRERITPALLTGASLAMVASLAERQPEEFARLVREAKK
jgi:hypothetical protein